MFEQADNNPGNQDNIVMKSTKQNFKHIILKYLDLMKNVS